MDIVVYIISGALVGLLVGITGVGGGSLMTPILILLGIDYRIAIGTDLLYAALTKAGGAISHARMGHVNWRLVGLLAAGSIPASLLTAYLLDSVFNGETDYAPLLTSSLGIMLILTALVLLFRRRLREDAQHEPGVIGRFAQQHAAPITLASGLFLGVFVTLSSVGAGAFCAALLMVLYPRLKALHVVGTDIAHAVPLTLIAGMSHWVILGNVDFKLLSGLLIGSLPAVHFGSRLAARIPNKILQPLLATLLLGLGIKFALF